LGNWELDISADRLIWSDEIYRIFGVDRERFAASYEAFLNLVHPDDRNLVDDAYTQSLTTRQPYALTHRLRMSDGRVKYVHEQCETSYDAEGKPLRSIGTVQDITTLKQKEQELERHQRHLKALAHQLTLAEEKERRAIAADLHDHIGHWLALARLQIKNMQTSKSALEKSVLIKDISNILLAAFTGTRKLISELSAPSMNEIGLGAAIAEFLEEQLAKRHGLATELVDQFSNTHGKALDDDQRAMLFRNVRELLVNVQCH
jgi:PAS domain S-box-containing protein